MELVDAMAQAPEVGDKEQLQLAVLEREEVMSTAIGVDVAVPHVKLSSVSGFVLAVGISKDGVDFDSTDGKPIRIVVMITGPADQHESYLKILSDVALLLRNEEVRAKIINAQTADEVIETFGG